MRQNVSTTKTLKEILSENEDYALYDLMRRILNVDPLKRMTCQEALEHVYFTGNAN